MATRLLATALAAAALSVAGRGGADAASERRRSDDASAAVRAAASGPGFLENGGRLPDDVDFTLDACDRTFFFGPGGVTVSLLDPARPTAGRWVLKLDLVGARPVRPVAGDERPGFTSVFKGPKSAWRVGLRTFGELVYRDAWPGVDLVWRAEPGKLKWECDVRPGADPSRIRFGVRGAETLSLGADGALTASTPLGDFADAAPVAWQRDGDRRIAVNAAFRLDCATSTAGVDVGAYDPTRPLVVDPATVVRTALLGGLLDDGATSVAVDFSRNVYVAGTARSPESSFPVLPGPDATYNGGVGDAFVAKLDSAYRLVWSGYLGGAGDDGAAAVTLDNFGNPIVAGWTASTDFPTVGALGRTHVGGYDAFVARINSSGRSIAWSGVFGGPGDDRALAVTTDRSASTIVVGRTAGGIAAISGIYSGGLSDAFVLSVRSDGATVGWAEYLGGTRVDEATGVAVDLVNAVYVCGDTTSPEVSFPATVGPDLTENFGQDAWVAKLDATTHQVVFAGFIGGALDDDASGIAVDRLGRAYVVGSTHSDENSFPATVGPHLGYHGKSDAYVARVAADGRSLEYCGYVGGTGDDFGRAIVVDAAFRAYVVGSTGSAAKGFPADRAKFPVVDGPDLTFNGGVHDGWLGVVQPDGSQTTTLGYIGGKGDVDDAVAVALLPTGDVVVAGVTTSNAKSLPATTGSLFGARGRRDAFVAQATYVPPSPVLRVPQLDAVISSGFDVRVDWTDADTVETGFDVQRTSADGTSVMLSVASTGASTGPVEFVDTTAAPGTLYAYRVREVAAAGQGEYSECLTVMTPPSLALKLTSGVLSGAGSPVAGVAKLRMKYAIQAGAAASTLDPVTDGISFVIAGAGPDQTVTIAPGDPGWTVVGPVATWTGTAFGAPRVVIDTKKRAIRLDVGALSFGAAPASARVRVAVTSGASHGSRDGVWRGVKSVRLVFP